MDFTVDNSRTTLKICKALVKAVENEIEKQSRAYPITDRERFKHLAHWYLAKTYNGIHPRQDEQTKVD
jgi:hypothetical protein